MVNENYDEFKNKPIEITLRNTLAKSYDISTISEMIEEINGLKKLSNVSSDSRFHEILKKMFY